MTARDRSTEEERKFGSGFIAAHPCPWCGGKLRLAEVRQDHNVQQVHSWNGSSGVVQGRITINVGYMCDKSGCVVTLETMAMPRPGIVDELDDAEVSPEPLKAADVELGPVDDAEVDREQLTATAEQLARLDEVTKG